MQCYNRALNAPDRAGLSKCGNQILSAVVPECPQPQRTERHGGFGGMGIIWRSLVHIWNIGQPAVKGMWGNGHIETCEL